VDPQCDACDPATGTPPGRPDLPKNAASVGALALRVAHVGIVLMAFMTGTKLAIMGWPKYPLVHYLLDLSTSEFGDFLYTLLLCTVGFLILWRARHRKRLSRVLWTIFIAIGASSILYSAISVQIISAIGTPLTYSLLQMAGDMTHMRSSIASFTSPLAVIVLAASPIAFVAAVMGMQRLRPLRFRAARVALVGFVAVYAATWPYVYQHRVVSRWGPVRMSRELLAFNPQWLLLKTYFQHTTRTSPAGLAPRAPTQYLDDFKTFGERAQAPLPLHQPRVKNVIVVVLESVGNQFLSVQGGPYPTTPNLQAEAKHSLIFNNFYSNAGSTPLSIMPLELSIYPGVAWELYTRSSPHLPGTTTAQILRQRGYRTAFMTSQDLSFQEMDQFLENRGFDLVYDYRNLGSGKMLDSWGGDDPSLFDEMLRWIDRDPGQPFYLCAWTQQTHSPYVLTPTQPWIDYTHNHSNQTARNLNNYLNTLRVTDEQLERLFSHLRQRGLADDTLVVITGDHGEAFATPHIWTAHGTSLYQESINIPLILWNPKLFDPGSRSATVGSHVDLNPTLLDLLGISPPDSWQGSSLFDPRRTNRAYSATTSGFVLLGLREDQWKFIYNATVGHFELYDLLSDPTEQKNVAAEQPARCKSFYERVSAWAQYEKQHMKELTSRAAPLTASSD
jgi:arylsulfatase A-like enzyme